MLSQSSNTISCNGLSNRKYPAYLDILVFTLLTACWLGWQCILSNSSERLFDGHGNRALYSFTGIARSFFLFLSILRNMKNDSVCVEKQLEILLLVFTYAVSSGFYTELKKGLLHWKSLSNIVVLVKIHKKLYLSSGAQDSLGQEVHSSQPGEWDEAARMLRFCCAVYGHEMVAAAEVESPKRKMQRALVAPIFGHRSQGQTELFRDLLGVQEQDILVSNCAGGGTVEYAFHTMVVDNSRRQIIFAIRGTLTLSECLRVMQAYATPFYGGHAHAGFVALATATWEKAMTSLKHNEFSAIPCDYELVFTGHSLGASVAILMAIMVIRGKLVQRPVRCVGFGPLPCFSQLSVIKDVLPQIKVFIYGNDFAPFDSIHQWRIMNAGVNVINQQRQSMGYFDVVKMLCGNELPARLLLKVASNQFQVEPVEGAPLLTVPAERVLWLRHSVSGPRFYELDAFTMQQRRPLVFCGNMLSDHLITSYYAAFENLQFSSKIN